MKTLLINFFTICLFFCGFVNSINAQTPFTKESRVVHAGIGLGGYTYGLGTNSTPIISATYDHGLIDDLGIGNLGIGGAFGAKFYSYNNSGLSGFSRFFAAARATYHFDFINSEKLDFYAGLMLGTTFYTGDSFIGTTATNFYTAPIAGINYWFKPGFGVYAEAGYGLGFLNGGIAINL